jgi:UPF0176 protein
MSKEFVVCAMYKFVRLEGFEKIQAPLLNSMKCNNVHGTLLLANEGINGTIAGSRAGVDAVLAFLESDERLANIVTKESFNETQPFNRSKVKLKKEIVTMGVEGIDPLQVVGTYVKPKDWNALIADPEVFVVDTRNDYEFEIGSFKHAINPVTETFREFPQYVKENMDPAKHKKVAMFCTGGIRCEKSTAYMKEQGFEEVYHLEGGILKYLEDVPKEETLWEGECFVFDDRVAVDHDLQKGSYDQCNACRYPITEDEMKSEQFIQGVCCPRCFDKTTPEQKERFQQRELQVQLAKARGQQHIGGDAQAHSDAQREKKKAQKLKQRELSLKGTKKIEKSESSL